MLLTTILVMATSLATASPIVSNIQPLEKKDGFQGRMTWYDKEGGLGIKPGACGEINHSDQFIVAMNHLQYGDEPNPNNAAICHKTIKINYQGREAEAQVTDKCDGCGYGSIDATRAVFTALVGTTDPGHEEITWWFV